MIGAVIGAVQPRRARACGIALSMLALVAGIAVPVMAQSGPPPAPRQRTWELSGGGVLVGGYRLGARDAELTPNSGSAPSFDQFTTDNRVRQAWGGQARIGFIVTPALVVEGGVRFTRPVFEVRVSGDAEGAADTTIEETLRQYVFDGSVVWHFTRAAFAGGRAVPFMFGGAGYLRELHEQDALVEEGLEYHAGGGVKWWFGQGSRRVGVRGDVGISIRDGGFDFADGPRVVPIIGGSVVYTF